MIKARCYFDFLNCLLSITPEGAGTSVLASVVPSAPSHFFSSFLIYLHFMLAGERAGGERKVIMYKGTPAKCFFSVLT